MRCEWEKTKLGDMVVFNPKLSLPKGSLAKKIAMEHLLPFSKYITKFELSNYAGGAKFMNGDTLLARITPCLENGKTSQVTILDEDEIGFGSTEFIVLRAKDGISDKNFIYYLSISPQFRDYAIKSMVGSSGRQRVQQDVLENMYIDCPSIPEQKAIAAVLSALDDKIELNNRINKNLEAQAQAIFKSWFVDFGPFRDGEFVDSELGQIPKGWRVVDLGDICESVSLTKKREKEKLIFLNTGDIDNGLFLHSNYSEVAKMPGQAKKSIQYGDILYSEIRPINKHFAYVNFDAQNYVVSTKLMVIRSAPKLKRRIYHYLTQQNTIDILQLEAETRSGTFPQIRFENIKSLKFLLADNDTEQKFRSFLECTYSIIDKNNQENQILAALRDTLLPKLMSGEIRVPLEV